MLFSIMLNEGRLLRNNLLADSELDIHQARNDHFVMSKTSLTVEEIESVLRRCAYARSS